MALAVNMEKWNKVATLNTGDKISLTDGSTAEFVRLKQKKFIGIINGATYDIPVNMFVEVVGQAEDKTSEIKSLKLGDPFYINKNGKAELFVFEKISGGRILAISPISRAKTRIDFSLYAGKVEDL